MDILETYTRVFVDAGALERTIDFYRELLHGEVSLRFAYPETDLELAAVSSPRLSVLIIAGDGERRRPFEATRAGRARRGVLSAHPARPNCFRRLRARRPSLNGRPPDSLGRGSGGEPAARPPWP
jgi:hypothetical protein